MKRGTNYNRRQAWSAHMEATQRLVDAIAIDHARRTASSTDQHGCEHLPSQHDDQEGCLVGWGDPERPDGGCMCRNRGGGLRWMRSCGRCSLWLRRSGWRIRWLGLVSVDLVSLLDNEPDS